MKEFVFKLQFFFNFSVVLFFVLIFTLFRKLSHHI